MKTFIIVSIATVGVLLTGYSAAAQPTPVPETSASLVPGPNHTYDVGGGVGVEAHANIGGSVGQSGK